VSDQKYRQRGYKDDDRDREKRPSRPPGQGGPGSEGKRPEREPGAPAGARRISSEGARNPRMMGSHAVVRCARCGTITDDQILSLSKCPKCEVAMRSCVQCVHFDPGASLECTQPIAARVSPKDAANDCPHFQVRTSWERETTTAQTNNPQAPSGAKKAFDDLFKF
jgi:hypothetical protein